VGIEIDEITLFSVYLKLAGPGTAPVFRAGSRVIRAVGYPGVPGHCGLARVLA